MAVTVAVQDPSHEQPAPLYLPTEAELPMQLHLRWLFFSFKHFSLAVRMKSCRECTPEEQVNYIVSWNYWLPSTFSVPVKQCNRAFLLRWPVVWPWSQPIPCEYLCSPVLWGYPDLDRFSVVTHLTSEYSVYVTFVAPREITKLELSLHFPKKQSINFFSRWPFWDFIFLSL